MNKKNRNTNFAIGFKSIQSTIFAAVSVLVLCAVIVATFVSVRYTNSAIYENSAIYTQTIIKQLNQNIDSYITYMDNIDSVIAKSQDAYQHFVSENRGRRCSKGRPRKNVFWNSSAPF